MTVFNDNLKGKRIDYFQWNEIWRKPKDDQSPIYSDNDPYRKKQSFGNAFAHWTLLSPKVPLIVSSHVRSPSSSCRKLGFDFIGGTIVT